MPQLVKYECSTQELLRKMECCKAAQEAAEDLVRDARAGQRQRLSWIGSARRGSSSGTTSSSNSNGGLLLKGRWPAKQLTLTQQFATHVLGRAGGEGARGRREGQARV